MAELAKIRNAQKREKRTRACLLSAKCLSAILVGMALLKALAELTSAVLQLLD